jgi:cytochrome c
MGLALLVAALVFDLGTVSSSHLQVATPMPTIDRLAQPTLPALPTQADRGAQVYWLSCLPCHGDRGQGLTDEFRDVYPPEDRNCWNSGCHGNRPYEDGFTLPKSIPAVIGDTTLAKFSTGSQLNAYIRAAMPFWRPGSLTEDESWQVTAYLLRENRLWDGSSDLNGSNASDIVIPRAGLLTPVSAPQQAEVQNEKRAFGWIILAGSLITLLIVLLVLKKSKNTTTI